MASGWKAQSKRATSQKTSPRRTNPKGMDKGMTRLWAVTIIGLILILLLRIHHDLGQASAARREKGKAIPLLQRRSQTLKVAHIPTV